MCTITLAQETAVSSLIHLPACPSLQGAELSKVGEYNINKAKKAKKRHGAPFCTVSFLFAADLSWGEKKSLNL